MSSAADSVDIRVIEAVEPAAIARLYRLAGWWEEDWNGDFIAPMLAGSTVVTGAFDDSGRLVGFGRAVSDGASDAYIQDVVVDPEFRRRGIAVGMVQLLLRELRRRGVDWIGLIGAPGTRSLYERCGFEVMPDYIPMHWSGKAPDSAEEGGRRED